MRCTEFTLNAFGIYGVVPLHGTGIIAALTDHGYRWEVIEGAEKTVRSFVPKHPTGWFYLCTAGHAMALVDGRLFDLEERGADLRRVQVAIRVFPPVKHPSPLSRSLG